LCDWLRAPENGSFEAVSFHGDKRQPERDWALNECALSSLDCIPLLPR